MNGDSDALRPFFNPTGIVLFGVSADPQKLGFGLARNLVESGYSGAVHFVGRRGGELFGRPVHPSLAEAPDPIELAVLLIPAAAVPKVLLECGRRGIRAAIIASGGFSEAGPEGKALEEKCLHIARDAGIRLLGPNCIGILDTHLPLDTTFLPPPGPEAGEIAFISHSGAICAAIIDWAHGQGFGLSRLISLGNQIDVQEADVLEPVAADPHTRVITLYLEGIGPDGRRFVDAAARAGSQKPLIALKVGRSAGGRQAAASHTGALAGREAAFDAAFRRAGLLRADTTAEMFHWAKALAWSPLPAGPRVGILTNAGGPGVTAADAIELNGLALARPSAATRAALAELLPPSASTHNPVDMLASASPEQYAASLQLLLDDEGVDSVLIILPSPPMYAAGAVARALIPIIVTSAKPVVLAVMGDLLIQEALAHLRAARIPEYRFPEQAASALTALTRRAAQLARPAADVVRPAGIDAAAARHALDQWLAENPAPTPGSQLPLPVLLPLLRSYGISVPTTALVRTAGEAVAVARSMGFPIALKVASEAISHKTDVGGVILNLLDAEMVYQGFENLMQQVRKSAPDAVLEGVYVQKMIPAGQEVIVGVVRDPQFGPLLMFGSGGVEVEGLNDIAFALAPATAEEAGYLLDETWAGRRLGGYRHLPPADQAAARDVIFRLGQLAADFPALDEIEINPLRVLSGSGGAVALDIRASWKP